MSRAERRLQQKAAKKAGGNAKSVQRAGAVGGDAFQPLIETALQHHAAGRLPEAENIYQQVLQSDPDHPDALHLLGVIANQVGRNDIAIELITKAITNKPNLAEAHNNLGNALKGLGRMEEAAASHQKALKLKPQYFEARYNLGNALQTLGRFEEAIQHYRKVISSRPDFADVYGNCGNALFKLGRLEEAISQYQKFIALKPDFADAYYNLGNALKALGRLEEAVGQYRQAISVNPDFANAHGNLANTLQDLERPDEAISHYRQAIALKPDFADAYANLSNPLQDMGDIDGALDQLDLALSHRPDNVGWLIKRALLLPIIPASTADIEARREVLQSAISDLRNRNLKIGNPISEVGLTNFRLAYHNRDNRSLMEDVAAMYIAACPALSYQAEHCLPGYKRKGRKIRIGVVSAFLREHTIGKLVRGIVQEFSHDIFDMTVFRTRGVEDHMSKAIDDSADRVVWLQGNLEADQKRIENEKPDILFYPDIGMSPEIYYLAFARLAPVQAMSWGHPDTTGIPNMDYFISSELLEGPDTARQYSERLIQLSCLPTYYYQPDIPENTFTRADYDLADEVNLYVCPQTLFKFHPDFDQVLGNLLRRDPNGRLVLIEGNKGVAWKQLIMERFRREFPDEAERVIFVPRMDKDKFLGLLRLADAILDIPTFSGGNSSLEAFAMAAPIVTWPGDFMRARVTAGCYMQMGLSDLIATNAEQYASLALRLAQDQDFKKQMQGDIKANAHKLYERSEPVRELQAFFIKAHEAWVAGRTL
jgi:protein O-GlcNAc transferase